MNLAICPNDLLIRPNESFICSNDSFIRSNDLLIRPNDEIFFFIWPLYAAVQNVLISEKKISFFSYVGQRFSQGERNSEIVKSH